MIEGRTNPQKLSSDLSMRAMACEHSLLFPLSPAPHHTQTVKQLLLSLIKHKS